MAFYQLDVQMKMTPESYREHMRKYSRDTAVMSYTVTNHPSYQVLRAAGSDIIQFLLEDLLDPNWHCTHCYGEGFEFPPDWVWDNVKRNWPTDTGIPCTVCNGKGGISHWACMSLLAEAAGTERPVCRPAWRGRITALTNMWKKWGEQRGYLPRTPDVKEQSFLEVMGSGMMKKILQSRIAKMFRKEQ